MQIVSFDNLANKPSDYIIENKMINTYWHYRRWYSGRTELWFSNIYWGAPKVDTITQRGGVYYSQVISIAYPITFKSVEYCDVRSADPWFLGQQI